MRLLIFIKMCTARVCSSILLYDKDNKIDKRGEQKYKRRAKSWNVKVVISLIRDSIRSHDMVHRNDIIYH